MILKIGKQEKNIPPGKNQKTTKLMTYTLLTCRYFPRIYINKAHYCDFMDIEDLRNILQQPEFFFAPVSLFWILEHQNTLSNLLYFIVALITACIYYSYVKRLIQKIGISKLKGMLTSKTETKPWGLIQKHIENTKWYEKILLFYTMVASYSLTIYSFVKLWEFKSSYVALFFIALGAIAYLNQFRRVLPAQIRQAPKMLDMGLENIHKKRGHR